MSSINAIAFSPVLFPVNQTNQPIEKVIKEEPIATPSRPWNVRVIRCLDGVEQKMDRILPNFFFQRKIDELGAFIQKTFAPLAKFNRWICSNGNGNWARQLAVSLCKLPLRVARNFVSLLYNIVRIALESAVHPAKAVVKLAKLLVTLVHMMSLPETWSKIGGNTLGASIGQGLVTGNPLSPIGVVVGGAMVAAGMTFGMLEAAVRAERGNHLREVGNALFQQVVQLPESFATGMLLGALMGEIQLRIEEYGRGIYDATIFEKVNEQLEHFGLPLSQDITLGIDRAVIIKWPVRGLFEDAKLWGLKLAGQVTIEGNEFVMVIPANVANVPPFALPHPFPMIFENGPLAGPVLPEMEEVLDQVV